MSQHIRFQNEFDKLNFKTTLKVKVKVRLDFKKAVSFQRLNFEMKLEVILKSQSEFEF